MIKGHLSRKSIIVCFIVFILVLLIPMHIKAEGEENKTDILVKGKKFNTEIKRLVNGEEFNYSSEDNKIRSIVFCPNDTIKQIYPDYYSLPNVKICYEDGNSMAYYDQKEEIIYIASPNNIQLNPYLAYAFSKFTALEEIDLSPLAEVKASYLHALFFGDSSLKSIEGLNRIDTSNCNAMDNVFDSCSSIESLDLSSWDVSNATNLSEMFQNCHSIKSINFDGWDTSNNTKFQSMFKNCFLLEEINIENWNTDKATTMYYTFCGCKSLKSINLSNWNLGDVKKLNYMFKDCSSLQYVELPIITSEIESMKASFCNCESLETINCSNWDVSNVNNFDMLFYNCKSVKRLDFSSWNTSSVLNQNKFLYGCESLNELVLGDYFSIDLSESGLDPDNRIIWYEINKQQYFFTNDFPQNEFGQYKIPAEPYIVIQPENQSITSNARLSAYIEAHGQNLNYQWQYKQKDGTKWRNFGEDSTFSSLTRRSRSSWDGWAIRCMVIDEYGTKVYSEEALITIVDKPSISVQPADQYIAVNQKLDAYIIASGTDLSYQWQYKQKDETKWRNFGDGSTFSSLTRRSRLSWDGWSVRCRVKDKFNNVIYSDVVEIHINNE